MVEFLQHGNHLSRPNVSIRLQRPTRNFECLLETAQEASRFPPVELFLLGLAPNGGCLAANIAKCAGGLLHHLFTLSGNLDLIFPVVCFCGPIRQVTPPRVLPDVVLNGVRTFLESRNKIRDRPTNLVNS